MCRPAASRPCSPSCAPTPPAAVCRDPARSNSHAASSAKKRMFAPRCAWPARSWNCELSVVGASPNMAKKSTSASPAVPLKLQGKSVFLAGNFYHLLDNLRNLVALEGGKVVSELSDKTDILVLGYSGVANPQKKAAKLNAQGAAIQVLSREQFEQSMKPTPDEAVQLLLSGPKGIERWNCHVGDSNRNYAALLRRGQTGNTAYIRGADFVNADLAN